MDQWEENRRKLFGQRFSIWLEKWEKKYHKRIKDFQKEVGCDKNSVTAWRQGKVYPTKYIKKICSVLEVSEDVFDPVLPFEKERCNEHFFDKEVNALEDYANRIGLRESFLADFTANDDRMKRFTFRDQRDITTIDGNTKKCPFIVEDGFGHYVLLSKADLKFICACQDESDNKIKFLLYERRDRLEEQKNRQFIQNCLKHLSGITEDEVFEIFSKPDFTEQDNQRRIVKIVKSLQHERGIIPRITISEIVASVPRDSAEYIDMIERANRVNGATEEQIKEANQQADEYRRQIIDNTIQRYKDDGWTVEDDIHHEGKC